MLSKNKIDEKIDEYIKHHLSKGYSRQAVKKILLDYGYDEHYVDSLLRKQVEVQFVKKYAVITSLLFLISFSVFNLIPTKSIQQISGFATVLSSSDEGCCLSVCKQTSKNECYGKFIGNKKCDELEDCNVGCCIDKEGYCLQNYLYGNCINGEGFNIYKDCNDIIFCRNITDKSYWARAYSIKDKKGAGFASVNPTAGYYKSSFNIRYYLYDKKDVISISANIRDANTIIADIELYDDGSHNDASKNDNLYANNWDSSKLDTFLGFKNLQIDINVEFADGTKQTISNAKSFVVLSNSKCLPVFTEWSNSEQKLGMIFAAQRYDNLSDGWAEFENDVNSFWSQLSALSKFSMSKELLNVYRLEESLSYSDVVSLKITASKSCPGYNTNKDLIILLDRGEDYCIKEEGIVRINPQVMFYKNASDIDISQLLPDFCKYALTPKMFADYILSFILPPKIVFNTLDNVTYNVSAINLSFSISSKNYPVVDSVAVNAVQVHTKTIDKDTEEIIEITLVNGTNEILVDAEDKNENIAFAQLLLNATIE